MTRHYYRYLKGEETSTNPVATIFAWSGALRKRGELDGLKDLQAFADRLEKATLDTINSGTMTKDLALLYEGEAKAANSREFLEAIAAQNGLTEILRFNRIRKGGARICCIVRSGKDSGTFPNLGTSFH